jgi:DNA modification methylase
VNQIKNVSKEKTAHPCQMPIEVMKKIIGVLPYDCTVIDPFMGSGTTICAVLDMNKEQNCDRKYVGIEMDEEYFNIAKEKINKH